MATGGESSYSAVTDDQFGQLMAAIRSSQERIDHKLAEFRAEVKQGQEDAAAKALKRVRHDKPYSFRRKGNEEQSSFNEKVEEVVLEAQAELADVRDSPAVDRAREALTEGTKLLAERQKLIKIADRSEYGWGVVAEYTADELADGSDDEKRLEKAEKAAERKALKRKRKRTEPPPKSARSRFFTGQAPLATSGPSTAPLSVAAKRPAMAPVPLRPVGPCFACGDMGHLRSYCPKMAASENRKQYPLHTGAAGPVGGSEQSPGVNGEVGVEGEVPGDGVVGVEDEVPGDGGLADWVGSGLGCGARCWETEAMEPGTQVTCAKRRLRERLQFWREEIRAPASVLDTIEGGYVLPLMSQPTPFSRPNHKSTSLHAAFVQQSVADLRAGNYIQEVPREPFICSPLSVVESSGGKKRLVINLRHLNRFLWKQKFKYEDLRVAMLLFERGDYLFSSQVITTWTWLHLISNTLGLPGRGIFMCLQSFHLVFPVPATCLQSYSVLLCVTGVQED